MAVTSLKEYIGVPRDTVANFNGKQLVYASWDQHLPHLF
jgi:phenol hydroxylase P4 protein